MEALQPHTYNGAAYAVGDTYEIDEQFADSVHAQGKAIRTVRAVVATKAPLRLKNKAVDTTPVTTTKTKKNKKK